MITLGEKLYFIKFGVSGTISEDSVYVYDDSQFQYVMKSGDDYFFEEFFVWNNNVTVKKLFSITQDINTVIKIDETTNDTTAIAYPYGAANFISMRDQLFFTDFYDLNAVNMYKTSGTLESTTVFHNMTAGMTISEFVKVGDLIVFSNETNPFMLSQTDLTEEGTVLVRDLTPGTQDFELSHNLTVVDGGVYFLAVPDFHVKSAQEQDTVLYYYKPGVLTAKTNALEGNDASFSVFPNPTYGDLNILSESEGKVIISDQVGAVVFERAVSKQELISTQSFSSGFYFVKFISRSGEVSVKKIYKK